MSKVKKSGKKHYEMLYIVSNRFTEEEVEPIVEKIHKAITDKGGEITYTENWGKKKMAYQIKGFGHGYYRLAEFNLDGEKLAGIDRLFRLSTDIIRHQIIVKRLRTMEEIEAEKQFSRKMMEEYSKARTEAKETKQPPVAREEKALKDNKADKKKVNLKELDEKLDKILESDNLL